MSTVDKALDILDLFSEDRPFFGLSEATRLMKKDKATTLRYLNALEKKGFVEQDSYTRSYHLGPSLARLALIREITYPVNSAAQNVLKKLVSETGESAHLSHFTNGLLTQVAIEETSFRGTRVYIDPAEPLTLHATASGIAYLSRCSKDRLSKLLDAPLYKHTGETETDQKQVRALAEIARVKGYATTQGTFESDVHGVAAPVFGPSDEVVGAIAVATPASRMNDEIRNNIAEKIVSAANQISRHYGASQLSKNANATVSKPLGDPQ